MAVKTIRIGCFLFGAILLILFASTAHTLLAGSEYVACKMNEERNVALDKCVVSSPESEPDWSVCPLRSFQPIIKIISLFPLVIPHSTNTKSIFSLTLKAPVVATKLFAEDVPFIISCVITFFINPLSYILGILLFYALRQPLDRLKGAIRQLHPVHLSRIYFVLSFVSGMWQLVFPLFIIMKGLVEQGFREGEEGEVIGEQAPLEQDVQPDIHHSRLVTGLCHHIIQSHSPDISVCQEVPSTTVYHTIKAEGSDLVIATMSWNQRCL